ncbi:MAG: integrase [Clostridiales bacterium]|nr:integrase [Clostridiales bacterium]
MSNYFTDRNNKNAVLLKKIKSELPFFCEEFFLGIDSKTSMLTKVNYARDLKVFFSFLVKEIYEFNNKKIKELTLADLNKLTATHLELYLDYLTYYVDDNNQSHSNTNKTKARKLSSLRTFFAYLYKKDRILENVSTKVDIPKINEKEIIRLDINEVVNILNLAETGEGFTKNQRAFFEKTKERDFAMLSLFLGTGIRISELVGLNINDFNFEDNSFVVTRKGGNRMILFYSEEVKDALIKYLNFKKEKNKELEEDDPFFTSLQNKRINVRSVENLVKKYAKIITPLKKITPHKLRSTFGTNLYNETKDIYVVAEVLGHKDVNTTKKHYAATSENTRRNALTGVKLRKDDD